MNNNNFVEKYNYIVFEDEAGKIFVIRDIQLKDCLFAGSVGNIKELERGTWIRPESDKDNTFSYIGKLINKRKEYMTKRDNKVINS